MTGRLSEGNLVSSSPLLPNVLKMSRGSSPRVEESDGAQLCGAGLRMTELSR
jgi:hypothetical protein